MNAEVKETLALVGKSILVVIGGIMTAAAVVDLAVGGWSWGSFAYGAVGLALCAVPLGLAFRSAVRAGRSP